MPLKNADIRKKMEIALRDTLGDQWGDVSNYGKIETKKIAETIGFIAKEHASGNIGEIEAKLLLRMQMDSARSVLLTAEGMNIVAAETAINSAIGAVGYEVNKLVGFGLCDTGGGSRDH